MITPLLLLSISIVLPLILYLFFPLLVKEILRDLRFLRILHYIVLAVLGIAIYCKETEPVLFRIDTNLLLIFAVFIVALMYAAIFAIITNNYFDIDADRLSNPTRPLVLGTVNPGIYLFAGCFCLIYSLSLTLFISPTMFYSISLISIGYYIYSCKPFRLKKIPFLSKLIIGFNSLVVCVCGYMLAGGQMTDFPISWLVFILLPLSLTANFIDLKDTEGDRSTGVITLPVLLGESIAKKLIVLFSISTYLMASFLINIVWIYPLCAAMALLHCFFILRNPYKEKPVFLIYITALIGLETILFFHKYLS